MSGVARLGIDIGGSGMKAAPVDLATGSLVADRLRIATPHPATPEALAEVVGRLVAHFDWHGPIGCTFPGVVKHGIVHSAANLDDAWVGRDAAVMFSRAAGSDVVVVNDADAAGLAEMRFGAGHGRSGTVVTVTLGTGIGTAVFADGVLLANTELGHIRIRGKDAEDRAADSVRERKHLSWKKWGKRVDEYLRELDRLLSPDLIIVGGGVSKKSDKFFRYLDLEAEVVAAALLNEAGIVGAALVAGAPPAPVAPPTSGGAPVSATTPVPASVSGASDDA